MRECTIPGTDFQSSEFDQKYIGNVCNDLGDPLTKFRFDTSKNLKEITKKTNMHYLCLRWRQILEFDDSRKTQNLNTMRKKH